MSFAQLRALAISIAESAGELLMERPHDLGVNSKSTPTDVVTIMDKRSEQHIVEQILSYRSSDGLVGEEGADRIGSSGFRWVIDPLDGTVNYLYGLPGWCISIAVQQERDGEWVTVAGAVHAPTVQRLYSAHLGGGATLNKQLIRCSKPTSLAHSLIGTGFNYDQNSRMRQGVLVASILGEVRDIRRAGAAALDLCYVASGNLDAYFERGLHLWDYAAGALIAQESGAVVSGLHPEQPAGFELTLAGAPLTVSELRPLLISGNAAF